MQSMRQKTSRNSSTTTGKNLIIACPLSTDLPGES
jgi:hypothetical protein